MDCDNKLCKSLCCHYCAVLTESELLELISNVKTKYAIEIEPKKFFRKVKGEYGSYYAIKMIKGQCIFLNKNNRCIIYMCRPKLCELYPVIDIDKVDNRCPMANKLTHSALINLKKRYAQEIDEEIKIEQTFLFA